MSRRTLFVLLVAGGALAYLVALRLGGGEAARRGGGRGPAPVAVAAIETGPIEERRTLTGSLEARERFVVAAHAAGRIKTLRAELGDAVESGQVIAELEDDGKSQDVAQARAELAAARAAVAEAESALTLAERELGRVQDLEGRGVVSPADLDLARAQHLSRASAVEVARARYQGLSASLDRARIRSGYNSVIAAWSGNGKRYVAARHVREGDRVSVGDPVVTIVALAPIDAVVKVTEKEYAQLALGQPASITTDAFPGRTFAGKLARLAPVFDEASRQARAEIAVDNPDLLLKPGMFARVELVLGRLERATIVPITALVYRQDQLGVFVVDAEGKQVAWRPVTPGLRDASRVAVTGEGLAGRVVTLGHQLVEDGSAITIPPAGEAKPKTAATDDAKPAASGDAKTP